MKIQTKNTKWIEIDINNVSANQLRGLRITKICMTARDIKDLYLLPDREKILILSILYNGVR